MKLLNKKIIFKTKLKCTKLTNIKIDKKTITHISFTTTFCV